MVLVVSPLAWLSDAPLVPVALMAAAALVVAYTVLRPSAHVQFAKTHGLARVTLPPTLSMSLGTLRDLLRTIRDPDYLPTFMLTTAMAFDEKPWRRRVPFFADMVMVSKPEHVEDVVKTQQEVFVKTALLKEVAEDTIGNAFFSLEGAACFQQRKIASRFFSPKIYREVATTLIHKHLDVLCGVLENAREAKAVVDVSRMLNAFTFQAFAELGFGLRIDNLHSTTKHPLEAAIDDSFTQATYRVMAPPFVWKTQRYLNMGSERVYRQNTTIIRSQVGDLVRQSIAQVKHKSPDEAQTLVELFIHAMQSGELEFSPELLCDLAVMFMIAGRDTTAGTLEWILYRLGKHPDVLAKVRTELWEKVPQFMDGSETKLTMVQTQTLTYLEATIKEAMRLDPLVPMTMREANRDAVLVDGTFVAKGSIVVLSPYVMGRLESIWGPDVAEFKPERFIDEATGKLKVVSAFKFFGFLAGPRICIGMNLAMLEMKLVLAGLLSRFELDFEPNDGSFTNSSIMSLKHPLRARVRSARATSA